MNDHQAKPTAVSAFFLLLIPIVVIYANTFNAAWHFDDRPNILNNYFLQLTDLRPTSLLQTLYTTPQTPTSLGKKMYRPVAFLTLGLNWYFGQSDPFGYHLFNIGIHVLTAFLLFLAIKAVLCSPNMHHRPQQADANQTALLAAVLWAVNPIHTQPVNYIVQRMALLAAFFSIAALFFYIRARMQTSIGQRVRGFFWSGICFLMAFGSKENAVILPFSVILLEFVFFQDLGRRQGRRRLFWILGAAALASAVAFTGYALTGRLAAVFHPFTDRPFTPVERLMTEWRILFHYLSQIFYPMPQRLSIEHDVSVSTSLIHPWTTLVALAAWLLVIAGSFIRIRKTPLVSFAILFFLLNHSVESTILPLELIFEHRNYLPSLFLFLPVAAALTATCARYRMRRNVAMQALLGCVVIVTIVSLGIGTHRRNMAWKTEQSLWQDAALKAPQSARPLANLAWILAFGDMSRFKRYDESLSLYHAALERNMPRKLSKAMLLDNLAGVYALKKDYQQAIAVLKASLEHYPEYRIAEYDLARMYLQTQDLKNARLHAEHLTSRKPDNEIYQNLKGLILLRQNLVEPALKCFQVALKIDPYVLKTRMHVGYSLGRLGLHKKAEWFLKLSVDGSAGDWRPLFCLIENSVNAGDTPKALQYADALLDRFNVTFVQNRLEHLSDDYQEIPIASQAIEETISRAVLKRFNRHG